MGGAAFQWVGLLPPYGCTHAASPVSVASGGYRMCPACMQ